jgi:hypothetical protein
MALLMIKCPHTARPVCTGVELEKAQLAQLPDVPMQVSCQACGMTHAWWKRESWLGLHGTTRDGSSADCSEASAINAALKNAARSSDKASLTGEQH